ncbi:palmitoyl-acyl carrier protein thioesterase, chloroplastic-like [Juglans regia]|uniref:Acyl-[acyl-carrier-protein] hydrolase n=1 Tax=Juglans regia TaxID=51240 RepID=A0A2I4HAN7_JUGRE|nr:palmitoyl-acyl carrier protein thioesterase, chloroplastic-like [Juglans regia]
MTLQSVEGQDVEDLDTYSGLFDEVQTKILEIKEHLEDTDQETAIDHVKSAGLLGDGFGSTPEMCKKNLIWVVTRMQVVIDRYPTCGA